MNNYGLEKLNSLCKVTQLPSVEVRVWVQVF